ncbi:MAG: NUDIX hydrolase [Patescibacteria group bacterium]|jgi:8-oxo-dGTP pyrophosphatase MutT (NUDIX family)
MRKGVMFLIYQNGKFLLEKRRDDDKRAPGLVIIPSGNQEENETPEETLKREIKEELGVTPKTWELLDVFKNVALNGDAFYTNAYLVTEVDGDIVHQEPDESEHLWATPEEADKLIELSGFRLPLFKALAIVKK